MNHTEVWPEANYFGRRLSEVGRGEYLFSRSFDFYGVGLQDWAKTDWRKARRAFIIPVPFAPAPRSPRQPRALPNFPEFLFSMSSQPNKKLYDWRRFWIPRDQEIQLDGGYFHVPEGEWKKYSTSNAVSFEDLANKPCLILLAEPGMGKSHVMKAACEFSERQGKTVLFLNLHSVGSEERFERKLFQDPKFEQWKNGSGHLHIFLDSLDEGLRRCGTLATILADELETCDASRLFIRIACRAAEWPQELEKALGHMWKRPENEPSLIYSLAPLQRRDVAEAAQANGLDSQNFLSEVARVRAEPLASKPITLNFLISTFQRTGKFPPSQTELYQNGCRILCEETAPRRAELSIQERLKIAGRIAVATIFGGFNRIWLRPDLGDTPDAAISVTELCGSSETSIAREPHIRETLETSGLFSPGGDGLVRWAHQIYAEFLAAWFINESKSPLSQIRSFLIAQDERLFPQFRETATWLAAMQPDFAKHILQSDPSAVLQSDFALVDHEVRESIAGKLLTMFDEELLRDDFRQNYIQLTHPKLAEQLKPYITDTTRGFLVRRVAVDIAEACGLQELQGALADVALDQTEEYSTRVNAAYAIWRIGDEQTRRRLVPLALGEAGDDPNDDLKGIGLLVVWPPRAINVKQMLHALTPPQDGYLGAYEQFLHHLSSSLSSSLKLEDLPIALDWTASVDQSDRALEHVQAQIFQLAIQNIDAPDVMTALATAFFAKAKRFQNLPIQFSSTPEGTAARRRLFLELVKHFSDQPDIVNIVYFLSPLFADDASWIIERFEHENSCKIKKIFARFICMTFPEPTLIQYAEKYDDIVRLCDSNPILKEACESRILCPIDPYQKSFFDRQQEIQKWQKDEEEFERDKPHKIEKLLDDFDAGDLSAWCHIAYWVASRLVASDNLAIDNHISDMTIFPVWEKLSKETKSRLSLAAERYLRQAKDEKEHWFGKKNVLWFPTWAAYRALRLLHKLEPEKISHLSRETWAEWTAILIRYQIISSSTLQEIVSDPSLFIKTEEDAQRSLIREAYQKAPQKVIAAFLTHAEHTETWEDRWEFKSSLERIQPCWDERWSEAFWSKAQSPSNNSSLKLWILKHLLSHGGEPFSQRAEEALKAVFQSCFEHETDASFRSSSGLDAALALFTRLGVKFWPTLWTAIQENENFGKAFIERIADKISFSDSADVNLAQLSESEIANLYNDHQRLDPRFAQAQLSESEIANLYIWMAQQYPDSEDPAHERGVAYAVSTRDEIAELKRRFISFLRARGTWSACDEISRIISQFPEANWLKWELASAQEAARRSSWKPPRANEIARLLSNPRARLAQNEAQLLDIVIESLERLNQELQGEMSAVKFLWDPSTRSPRSENDLSDYVALHFKKDLDGVIVGREVQIHPKLDGKPGDRTDIRIDAIANNGKEKSSPLTVIVEVKGCWHRDLHEAMRTQLAESYLRDASCRHGLYLVGRFQCAAWKDCESKKRSQGQAENERQDLISRLERQAHEISNSSRFLKAFVLDCSLREGMVASPKKKEPLAPKQKQPAKKRTKKTFGG